MAATAFHQAIGTLQPHGHFRNSSLNQENGIASFRLISKGFKLDFSLLWRGSYCSSNRSFSGIRASASHSTVSDPVSSPSNGTTSVSKKKSSNAISCDLVYGQTLYTNLKTVLFSMSWQMPLPWVMMSPFPPLFLILEFLQVKLHWFWLGMVSLCGMRRTCSLVVLMFL